MQTLKNIKYLLIVFFSLVSIACSRADEDEDVLSQEEHVVSGEMQETEGKAELEETE